MDSSMNCVKWATMAEQAALDRSQKTQGLIISIIAGHYLLAGLAILGNKSTGLSTLHHSIPLLISGAIALGTGVSVKMRKDASKAYDTSTQNMLVAGWSSLLAPVLMALITYMSKRMNRSPRFYQEKAPMMEAYPF